MRHDEDELVRCHQCKVMTYCEAIMKHYEGIDVRRWGYEDLANYAGLVLPCNWHAAPNRPQRKRRRS